MRRQMVTTMYNNVLSNVTFDIGLHEVCVRTGGRTLRHNQIFSDGYFTKFSYPWRSAPLRARFARAGAPLLENRRSSQGGCAPPAPPVDPPLIIGSVEVAYAVPSFDENYFV